MCRRLLAFVVLAGCGHPSHTSDAAPVGGDDPPPGGDAPPSGDAAHDSALDAVDAEAPCPPGVPAMHAELVAGGFTQPVFVTQPPGSTDLFVVEKSGRVKVVRNNAVIATFLDASAAVHIPAGGEGGLLSIAFAPDYVTSGRLFAFMTVAGDLQVIREYRRVTATAADPVPVRDLASVPNGGYNQIGGTVAFGPDHYLWFGTGDAGYAADAADTSTGRGKILRIDPDSGTPPPGNLVGYVWDYGLRNPFRFSFDRVTGELYIADAGEAKDEEVDVEPLGSGGRDYGWPRMEGNACHDGSMSCGPTGTLPVYTRAHEAPYSVIIGGVVYRGAALHCLRGRYLYAIFGLTGHVLSWVWNGGAITSQAELTDALGAADTSNIVGFGEDQAGEVYLVALTGAVYKVVPN